MTLQGTNTYVIGAHPAYVIDPGPADSAHLGAVRRAATERGGIAGVLLTHSHADHSAGVPKLGAPILFGEVGGAEEGSPERAAGAGDTGPGLGSEMRRVGPFEVLATPGHTADHVCFLYGEVGFCGDLILGQGSSFVPPDGGSLVAYLDSLERLGAADPELLCPGHGAYVTDPAAKIDEYRRHRLMREESLVEALDSGVRSRERLLALAWADVPPELSGAASVVMETHLQKLALEGRLPDDFSL